MSKKDKKNDSLDWIKQGDDKSSDDAALDVSGDLVLEGSLGIAEVESMHQSLSQILDAHVDVTIQSEDLSRVDAAGVQLIYAFVKEAKSRSISVKWASLSETLVETATMLGLHDGLGIAVASDA